MYSQCFAVFYTILTQGWHTTRRQTNDVDFYLSFIEFFKTAGTCWIAKMWERAMSRGGGEINVDLYWCLADILVPQNQGIVIPLHAAMVNKSVVKWEIKCKIINRSINQSFFYSVSQFVRQSVNQSRRKTGKLSYLHPSNKTWLLPP